MFVSIFSRVFIITLTLAALAIIAALPGTARAAPQILAAIQTSTPQPLFCGDGLCTVQLTTFCLQKGRSDPRAGAIYTPYTDTNLTLLLEDTAGLQKSISGNGIVTIRALRGFSAVVAEISEAKLQELGATRAALSVGPAAVLLPVSVADDPDPIRDEEIAYAIKTLRPLADQWLDGAGEKAAAVRLVNTMINATPGSGQLDAIARRGLWNQITGQPGQQAMDVGSKRAQNMFGACLWRVEAGRYPNLRSCLEIKHDSQLMDMNLSYWKATAAGS